MSWQDLVYGIGNVLFVIALIPSLKSDDKPNIKTSIMNSVVLVSFIIAGISLELYFTALVTTLLTISWAYLGYQKYRQKK